MKLSKSQIHVSVQSVPELRFEDQRLTSFSGCVLLQELFRGLRLRERLRECFEHRSEGLMVGFPSVVLILIVHLMLGFRRLRDIERYRDDPVVLRALGLRRMPNVSTVCRTLCRADGVSVRNVRLQSREYVLLRLETERLSRVTMDFDGSVISTGRFAEGTAVGYNNKRKGERSYYPLLCTIAQTAQVLDVFHRAGNVHDSHNAIDFMRGCIEAVRSRLPVGDLGVTQRFRLFQRQNGRLLGLPRRAVQHLRSFRTLCGAEVHDRIPTTVEASGLPVGLLPEQLGTQVLAAPLPIPVSAPSGEKAKQGACAVGIVHPMLAAAL